MEDLERVASQVKLDLKAASERFAELTERLRVYEQVRTRLTRRQGLLVPQVYTRWVSSVGVVEGLNLDRFSSPTERLSLPCCLRGAGEGRPKSFPSESTPDPPFPSVLKVKTNQWRHILIDLEQTLRGC